MYSFSGKRLLFTITVFIAAIIYKNIYINILTLFELHYVYSVTSRPFLGLFSIH